MEPQSGIIMNLKSKTKRRKEMQAKLAVVFDDELQLLSPEYGEILLDDLISAFDNRFDVLSRVQQDSQPRFEILEAIAVEAV